VAEQAGRLGGHIGWSLEPAKPQPMPAAGPKPGLLVVRTLLAPPPCLPHHTQHASTPTWQCHQVGGSLRVHALLHLGNRTSCGSGTALRTEEHLGSTMRGGTCRNWGKIKIG
jgi:hypothetical protein